MKVIEYIIECHIYRLKVQAHDNNGDYNQTKEVILWLSVIIVRKELAQIITMKL